MATAPVTARPRAVPEPRHPHAGAARPAGRNPPRWLARRCHASLSGLSVAVLFVCMSLTPSLLPRTWLVQGVISGVSASAGYALGAGGGWLASTLLRIRPRPRIRRRAWLVVASTAGPLTAVTAYQGAAWQRDIHRLMGEPAPPRFAPVGVLLVTVLLLGGPIAVVRGTRAGTRALARLLARWVPPRAARLGASAAVLLLLLTLLNGPVYGELLDTATSTAEALNRAHSAAVIAPASPSRSGSPASLVSWASLGLQGRAFTAGGPTVQQLRAFSGRSPAEPIRVYVGLHSAPRNADRAALAVAELRRTGAFSRAVLVVVTTTGTGWIDPRAADAVEYLYNGDTALVGMQYSYLPSWISFVVERDNVVEAGRELFNQVYAEWSTRPTGSRPKLLVFGESLGALGSEAPFNGVEDLRQRVDGALWVGPTGANPMWRRFVGGRDGGSTQVNPTFGNGEVVRFASSASDLLTVPESWGPPRVAYVQHASDPVTWWSPALLVRRPDWLRERRAPDVLPAMRWYPFVTFWQVTGDLAGAANTGDGHGHSYAVETVVAWAAIAPPAGWRAADTDRLVKVVTAPRLRVSGLR